MKDNELKRPSPAIHNTKVKNGGNIKILWSEYASYRRSVLNYIKDQLPEKPLVIYDPMAGTAPLIPFVVARGYTAFFNDILPLHYYTNRAKTYQVCKCFRKYEFQWFRKELLHCMSSLRKKHLCVSEKWIDDQVLKGLIHSWKSAEGYDNDIATLLKAVILRCIRPLSSYTKSGNPTWFKIGGVSSNQSLSEIINESLTVFQRYFDGSYNSQSAPPNNKCIFYSQDAANLHLKSKADVIITSPPYCNRLEYFVQYGPENYFLSQVGHPILPTDLTGTTKVRDYFSFAEDFKFVTNLSAYANQLLNKIKKSPNPDDQSYYLKYYTRYFADICRIFLGVIDNLSIKGKMYVVLQDNGHRGELIEIDRVLTSFFKKKDWHAKVIQTWEVHHLGLRNVSKNHAFVRRKQFEKILLVER